MRMRASDRRNLLIHSLINGINSPDTAEPTTPLLCLFRRRQWSFYYFSHYFINAGFFKYDGQLLNEVYKIRHIPCTIVQVRYFERYLLRTRKISSTYCIVLLQTSNKLF